MKENNLVSQSQANKYLGIIEKELSVREKETESNKEIQLKTLESSNKDSERSFEMFKLQIKLKIEDKKFIRIMGYISISVFIGILCFSGYLIIKGNNFGEKLMTTVVSIVIGGFGGWGLKSVSSKK